VGHAISLATYAVVLVPMGLILVLVLVGLRRGRRNE
jgi:hypothetical protein